MRLLNGIALILAAASLSIAGELTDASYRRAREILEAARAAHGGGDVNGWTGLSWRVKGALYARNQSPRSDRHDPLPFVGRVQWDLVRHRFMWEAASSFPGGFAFSNRTLVQNDKVTVVDLLRRVINPPPPGSPINGAALRDAVTFRIPQVVIARALSRAASLRAGQTVTIDGTDYLPVSFALDTGQVTTLFFDARTNLLGRYESLISDSVAGDATSTTVITGYREVGGMLLPAGHVQAIGRDRFQEYNYSEFVLNQPPPDAAFDTSEFRAPPAPAPRPLAVKPLGRDVHLVQGLGGGTHSAMFMAFKDHVIVVEAPLNDAASKQVMDKVAETVPGKPIRYVVTTHHHSDHVGGVRAYVAADVPIVTSPSNIAFFSTLARARFTLANDNLHREPREPRIEAVQNGVRVFTDGERRLEVHDVGPNSHAQEMLVVWVPAEKLLFVGDLMSRNTDGTIASANDAQAEFAATVQRLGWPVARIVDVHSLENTMADLRQSLELRAAAAAGTRTSGNR